MLKKTILLVLILLAMLNSCKNNPKNNETTKDSTKQKISKQNIQSFDKEYNGEKICYRIFSKNSGSINKMTVDLNGKEIEDQHDEIEIDGIIMHAEIADFDNDGYDKLLIYIQSAGSGSYGSVVGYSISTDKKMQRIKFSETADNVLLKDGYMGHDDFYVAGEKLIQTFPIYKKGDTNSNPTGGNRVVRYVLRDNQEVKSFSYESHEDEKE